MKKVKAIVLRAAGINCDLETEHALELAGAQARRVHINRLIENKEILDEFQPLVSAADGKRKRYATKKTPVETIASLSRVAEADHTLLWAFTCRVFLHPRYVNKQHPDRWSFRTWIAELAFWACEDLWDRIQGGQASGRTADSMAMRLLGHNGLGTLWNDLQSIEWGGGIAERWEKVDHWVDQNAERLSLLEEEMATLLHEFFGVSNWGFCSEEEFSKFNGMADAYWIIPAWYLVFVEGYGHTEVIEMLKPDPPEKAKVNNLVREMVRVRASSRGSAK